jgi:hypothetical protein
MSSVIAKTPSAGSSAIRNLRSLSEAARRRLRYQTNMAAAHRRNPTTPVLTSRYGARCWRLAPPGDPVRRRDEARAHTAAEQRAERELFEVELPDVIAPGEVDPDIVDRDRLEIPTRFEQTGLEGRPVPQERRHDHGNAGCGLGPVGRRSRSVSDRAR